MNRKMATHLRLALAVVLGVILLVGLMALGGASAPSPIAAQTAVKLAFTTQPSNTRAGTPIRGPYPDSPLQVTVQDASGNVVRFATNSIAISIGNNPGGATLSGATTAIPFLATATFFGLSLDKPGNGYTLVASSPGLTGATRASFNVAEGATRLAFTRQPSDTTADAIITPVVVVEVQDASGKIFPNASNRITISIGTNPSGGTLSGTTPDTVRSADLIFSNLNIDKPGNGYTLVASSPGLTGATSIPFNIIPGGATHLAFPFGGQPDVGIATAEFRVKVEVRDNFGKRVAKPARNVTLALGANPGGGTLSGTKTATAINGLATFDGLSIDKPGNDYTLVASSSGLFGATSFPFNLDPVRPSAGTAARSSCPNAARQMMVTIKGTGFVPGIKASFDGVPATNVTVVSPTTITATTTSADRQVITWPDGTVIPSLGHASFAPAPEVRHLTPTSGPPAGGTTVTLNGVHFHPRVAVCFGETAAASVTVVRDDTITASTPAHAAGVVDVVVFDCDTCFRRAQQAHLFVFGATTTINVGPVTLQGRTGPQGIMTVTLNPGGIGAFPIPDGSFHFPLVPTGTVTITASAAGYVSRQGTVTAVEGTPRTLPPTQLRCGLVNNDSFVNIHDITATVASFGRVAPPGHSAQASQSHTAQASQSHSVSASSLWSMDRVDAQGRFVDQNGDGFVNIHDITCVVSGFGLTSPMPWP